MTAILKHSFSAWSVAVLLMSVSVPAALASASYDSCCKPGAACCYPGSPCCSGHQHKHSK